MKNDFINLFLYLKVSFRNHFKMESDDTYDNEIIEKDFTEDIDFKEEFYDIIGSSYEDKIYSCKKSKGKFSKKEWNKYYDIPKFKKIKQNPFTIVKKDEKQDDTGIIWYKQNQIRRNAKVWENKQEFDSFNRKDYDYERKKIIKSKSNLKFAYYNMRKNIKHYIPKSNKYKLNKTKFMFEKQENDYDDQILNDEPISVAFRFCDNCDYACYTCYMVWGKRDLSYKCQGNGCECTFCTY